VSTHPRTRKRLEALGKRAPAGIRFMPPLGFADYVHLQKAAFCVLSDSGTLTEEASIAGFPGVMIREAHERPEGMDEGTVIMAGITPQRILEAVKVATERLASAAIQAGVRRFVFMSSIKVNGERTPIDRPFHASDKPQPEDRYARSKRDAERTLAGLDGKMQIAVVRPPLVYGPGVRA